MKTVNIQINPKITANELFTFYEKNNICEVGFGKETASRILKYPHLIVAAFAEKDLIGLARATFDGLTAHIMEFSLDTRYQGDNLKHTNGSLIESDKSGVGRLLSEKLLHELKAMGAFFITSYIVAHCEEFFYQSIGFSENKGHLVYHIDKRPYITHS